MISVVKFFVLTYLVAWIGFTAGAYVTGSLHWVPLILGSFAPSSVALLLTWREEGAAAAAALFQRVFEWRVGAGWYLFAAGYMAAIKLAVALLHRVITGAWPTFGTESVFVILAALVAATIFGGPLGEELGWRGYALPRLADRFGLAPASVIVGVAWASWHLPLFFIPGIDKTGQSFPVYFLQVTALSVAMAWLYLHTRGSLLLAVLMHAAVNQTKDIVPSISRAATDPWSPHASLVAWLTVALLWIGGAYFLVRMRSAGSGITSFHRPVGGERDVAPR